MVPESTVTVGDVEHLADLLCERLRYLSTPRLAGCEQEVRGLLGELAGLARRAEGLPPRPLPPAASRAFADQLRVLSQDLARALRTHPQERAVEGAYALLVRLRRTLP